MLPYRKKGFTLVEVLVAMGLMALIAGVTATLVLSAMSGYARGARMDQAKQLGLAIYGCYEARLRPATALQLGGAAPEGHTALSVEEGRVLLDGDALYAEAVYGGCEARIICRLGDGGQALALTVEILSEGNVLFVKDSAFSLISLGRKGGRAGGPEGPAVNPVIYYAH